MAVTGRPTDSPFEHLLRELTPQVLGTVMRRYRDFAAAEDAVQEASLAAARQWPRDGVPENPRAWLTQVALRTMADFFRSESARRRRESELALDEARAADFADDSPASDEDETLALFFMCCHPALTPASAIALTLRAVGGLTTSEIAHAFLVPEATMAQRISRAKQTIVESGIPFRRPVTHEQAERLRQVLHVLYLMFNEGYTVSAGAALYRTDLAREAIRLARTVRRLQPQDTETAGLLALMLLTDARRNARTNNAGELVPLEEQDRAMWNREQIVEGVAVLSEALPRGSVGPYQLQAAIAALHDEAPSAKETDWLQILALYDLLSRMSDNPLVRLNQAVAAAMAHGPARGLELLDSVSADARLADQHRVHAVRAHLLELHGEHREAISNYHTAAAKTNNLAERNYLLMRAARLSADADWNSKAE
jgi:RNA polymerase sigma factor (sigma-70 family)